MSKDRAATSPLAKGLADRLKAATWSLHRQAERTGIIGDLLRGRCSRASYALFLRNLLPVYEALEHGLRSLPPGAPATPLARPEVYRAATIRADLTALTELGLPADLPLLPAAERYADAVRHAAAGDGALLAAHAYTRYLGDLNGGQILGRLLAKHLGLPEEALGVHRFRHAGGPSVLAADYRAQIDALVVPPAAADALLEEARLAFRLSIALSEAVAGPRPGLPDLDAVAADLPEHRGR